MYIIIYNFEYDNIKGMATYHINNCGTECTTGHGQQSCLVISEYNNKIDKYTIKSY